MSTLPAPPPFVIEPNRWLSAPEFAKRWNRAPRTIRWWCKSGYLVEAGIQVFQDIDRRKWWIRLPDSEVS